MSEREKVISGLRACADHTGALCRLCPYDFRKESCISDMAEDALELLLREQPEVAKAKVVRLFMLCPECGEPILNGWKHCAHCGAKLEEGEA